MASFRLSDVPLDPAAVQRALQGPVSGGFVSFEGWVRDHNDGKAVLRLEYEAYPALAEAEGQRIIDEACARFHVHAAACVHRTGALAIGDLAVIVGVASAHRAEAFAACRYIIDEVKQRVPIWKKEHYADGDSGWVNCEACAHPHGARHTHVTVTAADYYARQTVLPEVGAAGQAKLAAARVLVVGAGGLGCATIPVLAAAGVGTLGICDGDPVEASNLHRQTLFHPEHVGQNKAEIAAAVARAHNPLIRVHAHLRHLDEGNARAVLADYDVVLDCTDNFLAKYLLNDSALVLGKLLIQASIHQYEGQLFVVRPLPGAPCLRCLWPEPPAPGCIENCAQAGVLGSVPAVFGALQANEALKQILGLPGTLTGELVLVDLLTLAVRKLPVPRADACAAHAAGAALEPPRYPVEFTRDLVTPELLATHVVIDLREPADAEARPLPWPARALPLSTLTALPAPFDPAQACLLVCPHGVRSRALAQHLRALGVPHASSLRGGAAVLPRP